jgi:outer membrane receptor protein involved in Fe transport
VSALRAVLLRGLVVALAVLVPALPAAEGPRRAFDLPAAAAEDALRTFTEQSGVELAFNVQQVQGVRTRAVRGRLTPRAALERLLAGTPLTVVEDPESGALFVHRKPSRSAESPAPRRSPEPGVRAATAAAGPSAASGVDAVVLNPFLVETSRERGYTGSTTLAGTRLTTPLRDIGAAVSVYRKDLLSDLGVASHQELLVYATSMEAAGPGGNFSNSTNNINEPQVVGDEVRISPQTQSRTRGLAAPNGTRGFFATDIAGDAYNTEAITISRGPNAILFGAGSPAGVVDTTLIKPHLYTDGNRVELRYGDNDSFRRVIDLNRALIPGRLALRLAALEDEERFDQRPAFERKRRIFGAATFEPMRSLTLRASFESGHTHANRPTASHPRGMPPAGPRGTGTSTMIPLAIPKRRTSRPTMRSMRALPASSLVRRRSSAALSRPMAR